MTNELKKDIRYEYEKLGISEHTMREMAKFFMETSIPRIIKQMEQEEEAS